MKRMRMINLEKNMKNKKKMRIKIIKRKKKKNKKIKKIKRKKTKGKVQAGKKVLKEIIIKKMPRKRLIDIPKKVIMMKVKKKKKGKEKRIKRKKREKVNQEIKVMEGK